MNETPPAQTQPSGTVVTERLKSLDAYRGLIMVTLAFGGFGLVATAGLQLKADPESAFWKVIQHQCVHAQWTGCRYWDMIQPSFMFMVGVSMAYSYAKRRKIGHSYVRMLSHAGWRSIVLVYLGVFLSSNGQRSINWTFANVLCQIGLGYCFLFLLWRRSFRTQVVTAAVLLDTSVGHLLYRMVLPDPGDSLRHCRCSEIPPLDISFGRCRRQLHRHVLHVAPVEALGQGHTQDVLRPGRFSNPGRRLRTNGAINDDRPGILACLLLVVPPEDIHTHLTGTCQSTHRDHAVNVLHLNLLRENRHGPRLFTKYIRTSSFTIGYNSVRCEAN